METISIIPTLISVLSVCIASLIYINSKEAVKNTQKSLKQSQDKYLYELRLNALKYTKEVEIAWQTAINDIYHEKERIKEIESNLTSVVKEMFDDVESGLLKPSLDNVSNIRKKLEEKFDDITEEEAKLAIRTMELINISFRQIQDESVRKYQLLYNELREKSSQPQ